MQYGIKVNSYKRVNQKNKEKFQIKTETSLVKLVLILVAGFLISRVTIKIDLNSIDTIAPFGIAYLLSNLYRNKKNIFASGFGVFIGYLSLFKSMTNLPMYMLMTLIIVIAANIPLKLKKRYTLILNFVIVFATIFVYGAFIVKYDIVMNSITTMVSTAIIYPVFYIIRYGLDCIEEINTQHFFTMEELISIALFVCLTIVGIGEVSLLGIQIRSIIALFFVITTAYVTDSTMGACLGITMGLILGFSANNPLLYVTIYSCCGLVASLFREGGKILTFIAFNIIFIIISLYSRELRGINMVECLIGSFGLVIMPKNILDKLSIELNGEKKEEFYSEVHFKKIKEELTSKLRDFTDILSAMSGTLDDTIDNDKLLMKNQSSALIDNLGERTCSECDMKFMCWKRELHATYNAFAQLIEFREEGNNKFPDELEKKCVKKYALIKNAEDIVNTHITNEMFKKRLGEGRRLLANHINNMAVTVGEIIDDFSDELVLEVTVEKTIRKALTKAGVRFYDILCYTDKNGRLNIKMQLEDCSGTQYCVKELLPVINNSVGKNMSIAGEGCSINPKTRTCEITIEEAPKYHISSYAAVASKEGEYYTGDSYSYGKTKDGNYMIVISDGMGSGPEAGVESKIAVELIEKFTEVGFSEITAIDAVNSIMSIKFSENEKFSTLDMQKIDLYTGNVKFMKVGAVESFIKRGKRIEVINNKTLPFGILEQTDIDIVDKSVVKGDMIISISDGILDVKKDGSFKTDWLVEFLKYTEVKQPKDLAYAILEKAKELGGGKAKDDMTVIVSKVINLR